jgi:hypothetical protein
MHVFELAKMEFNTGVRATDEYQAAAAAVREGNAEGGGGAGGSGGGGSVGDGVGGANGGEAMDVDQKPPLQGSKAGKSQASSERADDEESDDDDGDDDDDNDGEKAGKGAKAGPIRQTRGGGPDGPSLAAEKKEKAEGATGLWNLVAWRVISAETLVPQRPAVMCYPCLDPALVGRCKLKLICDKLLKVPGPSAENQYTINCLQLFKYNCRSVRLNSAGAL